MSKRRTLAAILGLGLSGLALYLYRRWLLARLLGLPSGRHFVRIARNLRVPMPDGAILMADHYAPRRKGAFPTILIRSPYGRGSEAGTIGRAFGLLAWCFASHGYHAVVQTTRGRFDSEGEYEPLVDEAQDGLATVEWIAQQPWFNGILGMWGPSYLGYATWAVAAAAPPQLKAIVPSIAFSRGYPVAWMDGAFALDLGLRALFLFDTVGNPGKWSSAEARKRWSEIEQILDRAFQRLPLVEADVPAIDQPNPFYREAFNHPDAGDPYWQSMDHQGKLGQVEAAPLLISGWYDLFLRELLSDYATLEAAGRRPYLTIGPWYHAQFGYAGEFMRESLAWFDAHLRSKTRRLREKRVRIYVMGADEWRELESWPPQGQEERYYLQAQGVLSSEQPPAQSPPDQYRYDPQDPTPNLAGPLLLPPAGPVDNAELEARDDVLCYTTPVLTRAVEAVGPVRLELYVRSSRPHSDFLGRLCDVHPDGRSINVCDGLLRVEPGKGEMQPDGSLRIVIDMWATAYRFQPGHRMRLQVSSGAHPRWNRNLGTGEPVGTGTAMVSANQTIYHDREHPSALVLPII